MAEGSALQKIAERILEDESLRRGLTDTGFQPLLDWAMMRLNREGRKKSDLGTVGSQLRSILQASSLAASSRDVRPLRSLLKGPVFSSRESTQIDDALSHLNLTDDTDANSIQIANVLSVKR